MKPDAFAEAKMFVVETVYAQRKANLAKLREYAPVDLAVDPKKVKCFRQRAYCYPLPS